MKGLRQTAQELQLNTLHNMNELGTRVASGGCAGGADGTPCEISIPAQPLHQIEGVFT